jgi:hypothetical protein
MELVWFESPQWSPNHTCIHTYIAFNQLRKGCIPILCTTILVNNKQMKVIPSCDTYQVCPRWCLIVGFLTSFCAGMFLWMFHSIGVWRLLHSPAKRSWTRVCGMDPTSMDFLFEPSWHSPLTHTKSTWTWWLGWVLDLYTLALGARSMSLNFLEMPSIFYPNNKHEKGWLHGICMVVIK